MTGRKIGYAQTSQRGFSGRMQILVQTKYLESAGCTDIFVDSNDGKSVELLFERPGLKGAMEVLKSGDELIVYRSDRISRSQNRLADLARQLSARGIVLVFLNTREFSSRSSMLH